MRERFAFHLLIFVLPLFWHTRYDWQFWLRSLNELEDIMHQNNCYKLNLRILGLTRNLSSPCVTGYFYAHDTGGHRKKSLRWQRLTKIGFMFIWWGLIIASLIHANYLWVFFWEASWNHCFLYMNGNESSRWCRTAWNHEERFFIQGGRLLQVHRLIFIFYICLLKLKHVPIQAFKIH